MNLKIFSCVLATWLSYSENHSFMCVAIFLLGCQQCRVDTMNTLDLHYSCYPRSTVCPSVRFAFLSLSQSLISGGANFYTSCVQYRRVGS